MKRFHVHVDVTDLDASVKFYSQLFGAQPTVVKPDYAKWMVDEPRLNFAVSTSAAHKGVSHLGLEADSADELEEIQHQFAAADQRVEAEPDAACCYARSDKHWVTDPQGIRWEGSHSRGLLEDEIAPADDTPGATTSGCCAPKTVSVSVTRPTPRCCG